jgi:hypothetical protein
MKITTTTNNRQQQIRNCCSNTHCSTTFHYSMKSEENVTAKENWTTFDILEDDSKSQQSTQPTEYPLWMESVVRVTCAGFCGALVGMSRQNQQSSKIFQRAVVASGKKRPPRALPKLKTVQQSTEETNLPLQWSFSFMAFVSILETSRFWSPTTLLMNHWQNSSLEEQDDNTPTIPPEWMESVPDDPKSLATIVDCTIGGTVAGLAGGMAKQRPPPASSSTSQLKLPSEILKSGRRSLIWTGIGTGMALGLLAGSVQAGLDIMESYAVLEESRQEELQAQRRVREMEERLEKEEAAAADLVPNESRKDD